MLCLSTGYVILCLAEDYVSKDMCYNNPLLAREFVALY